MKLIVTWILCSISTVMFYSASAQNVWTQHNDQGRTGWYPYESTLTIDNVNQNTFGFNFSHTTDDKVVSQPLVVMNVNIPGIGNKNVVYVTTLNNTIYAYDADVNADPYWTVNYTNKKTHGTPDCVGCFPATAAEIHPDLCGGSYGDFTIFGSAANMGIVGTPVIDTLSGTMYFVTKVSNHTEPGYDNHNWNDANPIYPTTYKEYGYTSNGFHQYLHAIDITTGAERPFSPVEINPTNVTGTGDGQTGPNSGILSFNPRTQFNRAGLAMANGNVYIAFAAHCDNNPSHGWVISYKASDLSLAKAYVCTPNDGRGGIWMSGTAPAIDENGNIYFATGNSLNEHTSGNNINRINNYTGSVATDPANRGESVVELHPDLSLASYFTPFNFVALNDADLDFPIQVMLLPGTNLAMTGCKDGNFYIMNKNNLGGFNATSNGNKQTFQNGGSMHSSFAYFGGATPFAYQYSEQTQLLAYPVTTNGLNKAGVITNTAIPGPSYGGGAFLSVSSKGTDPQTGILWAYQPITGCNANNSNCHAVLHALNASDITKELWNSDQVAADQINIFNKFSCPTIALGKVYLAANQNHLYCYGLKTNLTCLTNVALGSGVTASTTSTLYGGINAVIDGNQSSGWVSMLTDNVSVTIDLKASYDICRIAIYWQSAQNSFQGTYAYNFDISVSDNGTTWTTLRSVRGNTSLISEINSGVTARYVMMKGITRGGTSNGYGINEFQIFGSPASPCRTPSGLTASSVNANTEHISWDPISGISQYTVKYHSYLSQEWLTKTVTTNSIDLPALTCGTLYYYSVQGLCGAVLSSISTGSFTPTGCAANTCDLFPVRFYNLDLGNIGVAGSTCLAGTTWNLKGSGTDIGGISDQFQFAYTNINTLDYEALGRLAQQDQIYPGNKLGIMVRDSITSTSRFAYVASVNNGANFIFEYRLVPGGPVTTNTFPAPYPKPWMKVVKTGTNYTGFISPNGITWSQIGTSVNLNFGINPNNIPSYGMAVTSANNTALSSGQIDNFIFQQSNSSPLPVMLLNFTANEVNHDHVLISWATSMEHLSDYFIVMKSVNGKDFQPMDKVNAAGESESELHYSINDNKPSPGTNYYRLKEVDKDGKFYLSPIVSVKFDVPNGFEIYPNPTTDYANITTQRDPITDVKLMDATGKTIQNIHLSGTETTYRLNVSALPLGIYFVSVKTNTAIYRQKLVKK
jgi:F5/8 type C domain/Secretion system C-terminal sorting domain/Fibronectin type III domain